MPGSAAKVVVTERQQAVLETMSRSRSIAVRLRQRSEIIRLAFDGRQNHDVEPIVALGTDLTGTWRGRWQAAFERLTIVEGMEQPAKLRQAIAEMLSNDRPAVVRRRSPRSN